MLGAVRNMIRRWFRTRVRKAVLRGLIMSLKVSWKVNFGMKVERGALNFVRASDKKRV